MKDGFRFEGTITVVGGGRMGEAIVAGLLKSGVVAANSITIAEPNAERRETLAASLGVTCVTDAEQALPADVALIAVKPQIAEAVLTGLSARLEGALVVSIVAGFTCAHLESLLPVATAVVRVMPNTPAMVGEGMAVVSGGNDATASRSTWFARCSRRSVKRSSSTRSTRTPLRPSPGRAPRTSRSWSMRWRAQAWGRGCLAMSRRCSRCRPCAAPPSCSKCHGQHPEALVDGVASPGGTTIAALERLEAGGLRAAFAEAVAANVKRAEELGS